MSWKEFCELNVPKKYLNCSIENLSLLNCDGESYLDKAEKILNIRPNFPSLILTGDAGRGKTYFMFSLIRALLDRKLIHRHHLYFCRMIDFDNALVHQFSEYQTTKALIELASTVEFLFIDDFGISRSTEKSERDYYDIIDKRVSNELPTIISTNMNMEQIKKQWGERIHSRFKEFFVIEFKGPDLRGNLKI